MDPWKNLCEEVDDTVAKFSPDSDSSDDGCHHRPHYPRLVVARASSVLQPKDSSRQWLL